MVDLDLAVPLASPNPATTDWIPLGNTGSVPTTQPSVRVYRSTAQSINAGTWTPISFDTVRYDVGPSPHWAAGSPTRLTCQVAGTYMVWGTVQWGAGSGSQRTASIVLNGTVYLSQGGVRGVTLSGGAGDNPISNTPVIVRLNVGDYVELQAWHNNSAALSTSASDGATAQQQTEFAMALLGGQQGPPGFASPPTYATTLPASPVDGQEAILVDSVTNPTYQWRFRWNAGSSSAYKWEFVGGPPVMNGIATQESTTSVSFTDLATIGPSITLPRAGDYMITTQGNCQASVQNAVAYMAPRFGATATQSGDAVYVFNSAVGGIEASVGRTLRYTGLAASLVIKAEYRTAAGTAYFAYRILSALPIRVS